MIESGLTTARERELFADLLAKWIENRLPDAPREQLRAIEDALYRYRPAFRDGRPLYGENGSQHLFGGTP